MLRMLMTTTALVSLTGAAFADAHLQANQRNDDAAMSTFQGEFMMRPHVDTLYADEVTGMTVYATADRTDSIGEIEELVLSRDGSIQAAVIGIGGFLEIGEKDVAVSWDSLQYQAMDDNQDGVVDERFFVFASSRESLEGAPEFDWNYREDMEMAAVRDSRDPMVVTPGNDTTALAPAPVDPQGTPDGAGMSDGVASMDRPVMDYDRDSMASVGFNDLRAEDLIGQRVYGQNNEDVGEIGDLILTEDGSVDAVIIDFGGFLGLGEKEVAVGFESVDMRRDENNTLFVYTDLTEDDLEAAPTYDAATYRERRDEFRTISGPGSRS